MSTPKPIIVLLHGHTASGKSTLARKLAQALPRAHSLHSALVRRELGIELPAEGGYSFDLNDPVFVDTVSRQVYARLVTLGSEWIEHGESVIFDAAFNFYRQRLPVYELAARHNLGVQAIRCVCRNDAEVRQRLLERAERPNDAFSEASEYSTYLSTRRFAEDIELDWGNPLGPENLLEYDSLDAELTIIGGRGGVPRELMAWCRRASQPRLESVQELIT